VLSCLTLYKIVSPGRATVSPVSYDMFVQRFEHGDAAPMGADAFRSVFGPSVDRREPQLNYWHVCTDDGGTADVYAALAGGTLDSVMISRFSGGLVLDMLVRFIVLADAVVLPPGCPTLLADEGQRHHLPEELRAEAVVVQVGADVELALQSC
jgi:hypothetical protein